MTEVVGVDGARVGRESGWVLVRLDGGRLAETVYCADFDAVLAQSRSAEVIGVDMPIGLTGGEPRHADNVARRALGRRASSIFATPSRPVLEAADYDEACRRSRELCGKGLSRQAWMLAERIRQVDAARPDPRLHEVHPELSFLELSGSALPSKKTWNGLIERMHALRGAGLDLSQPLEQAGLAAPDDVLDAAVVAWTAERIRRGEARSHPPLGAQGEQRDGEHRIAIWS